MTEALDYYASFFKDGLSPDRLLDPGELESGFAKGTYGAFISGPWHTGLVEDAGVSKDQYAVAPLPGKDSAPGTSFVGGGDLAVFKDSDNADAAWKYVQWLTDPDTQQGWYDTIGDLPAVQSAWDSGKLASDPQLQVFGDQLQDTQAPPAVPTWEQVAAQVDSLVEQVTKSDLPAERRGQADAVEGLVDRHRSRAMSTLTQRRPARPSRVGTPSRHVDPTRRQQAVAAWVLALPFVVLFLVFTAGPVLASLGMSFTDLRSTDIRNPLAVDFVGLDNYVQLVQDPLFRKVTFNTLLYLVLGVPLTMGVALAAAVGLNRVTRLRGFFRVGYYLPVVTSIVAVSVVWKFLLRDNGGLVNTVLAWVGIAGPGWLDSTTTALPTLVVMAVWRNFGTLMVIFLAGLQTVPREVVEAAETDGASAWSRFRYITLPMLRPTMLFGAVITSIGYLQFFEEAFVMTKGGPLDSTRSITYFTYDQFGYGNYGYAAAASYLLFLAIVGLTLLQFRLLREKD